MGVIRNDGQRGQTSRQKKIQGLQDISDIGESGKQRDFTRDQKKSAAKRAHETSLQKTAGKQAMDRTLAERGVVRTGGGTPQTAKQKRLARKKIRDKFVAETRRRQAFDEGKKQHEITMGTRVPKSNTFRGGAPIRIQTRKGGPTMEFTRDMISRGGKPLAAAQNKLRSESATARQDHDITTGRSALERLSGQKKEIAEGRKEVQFRRGIGSPSANRHASSLNVEGMPGYLKTMADITRMRNALADRSAQQATGQAPAPAALPQPPVVAQTPPGNGQTDAGGFPLPPPVQPTVAPVGPQATPGSVPTITEDEVRLPDTMVDQIANDPNLERYIHKLPVVQQKQVLARRAISQQVLNNQIDEAPLPDVQVDQIARDPNLGLYFSKLSPVKQRQIEARRAIINQSNAPQIGQPDSTFGPQPTPPPSIAPGPDLRLGDISPRGPVSPQPLVPPQTQGAVELAPFDRRTSTTLERAPFDRTVVPAIQGAGQAPAPFGTHPGPAAPPQAPGQPVPFDQGTVAQFLNDPNLQSYVGTMHPIHQQQLTAALAQRFIPPERPTAPPQAPQAFARPFAIPEENTFFTPGQEPPRRPELSELFRGPQNESEFSLLPEPESKRALARAQADKLMSEGSIQREAGKIAGGTKTDPNVLDQIQTDTTAMQPGYTGRPSEEEASTLLGSIQGKIRMGKTVEERAKIAASVKGSPAYNAAVKSITELETPSAWRKTINLGDVNVGPTEEDLRARSSLEQIVNSVQKALIEGRRKAIKGRKSGAQRG